MSEPPSKRAKSETSQSASTTGDTQGVSTPVAMDNADSMNRGLSNEATGEDVKVPKDWFLSGAQDFKQIRKVGSFADHTLLIEKLIGYDAKTNESSYKPVLITTPRRFGKSINLTMVKHFVEIQCDEEGQPIKDLKKPVKDTTNYELFAGTNIMKDEHKGLVNEHFGRHPVIYLNFKGANFSDSKNGKLGQYEKIFMHIREVLRNAIIEHKYLEGKLSKAGNKFFSSWCDEDDFWEIDEKAVQGSLLRLTTYLYDYFKRKVFILVDEYDAIPTEAIRLFTKGDVESANKTFMVLLGTVIKGNAVVSEYVQGAMMTGVSYLGGIGMSVELNNVEQCRFLENHRFVQFYGFTESEVNKFATFYERVSRKLKEKVIEELRHQYNGYQSEVEGGEKMYSLWSVGNYLQKGELKNYWGSSDNFYHLVEMLKIPSIFVYVLELLNGKILTIVHWTTVSVDIMMKLNDMMKSTPQGIPNSDLLFSMMLEQGYLTMVKLTDEDKKELQGKIKVKMPNEEIKSVIRQFTQNHFRENWGFDDVKMEQCARFFEKVKSFATQEDKFKVALKDFYDNLIELFKGLSDERILQMNEDHLHCLMYIVCSKAANYKCSTEYRLYDDEGTSSGRLDLLMLSNNFGIIVEFKCNKTKAKRNSSLAALKQILLCNKTNYTSALTEHKIEKYLLMGLSIDDGRNPSISCLLNSREVHRAAHLPDYKTASCT